MRFGSKAVFLLGLMMLVLAVVSGCVSLRALSPSMQGPEPVDSGLHSAGKNPVFVGVGSADGIQSRALLRATADSEARKALAEILQGYVKALVGATKGVKEDHVYVLTRQAMGRAVITNHWSDPAMDDGRLYAKCTLSLAAFKEILAAYRSLDAADRETMLLHADVQFDVMKTD